VVKLPTGKSVWHQPDAGHPDGFMLPFRPDQRYLGLTFIEDTPHDWKDTHAAWNGGVYDQWAPNKGQVHGLFDKEGHSIPVRLGGRI